jgi:RNA polymerase sigma-70 factor, ECF subfamily
MTVCIAPQPVETGGEPELRSLLDSCAHGNESAFETLYDRTVCVVLALARCRAPDEETAQEATRAAYVELWTRAHQGRVPTTDVLTWVAALAHRHAGVPA